MPELPGRLEQFSRLLAAGMLPTPAARASGFTAATADAKARRMAARADVAQRVAELRAATPQPAAVYAPAPAPVAQQSEPETHQPEQQPEPRQPAAQAPIPQPPLLAQYEPPRPLPRIDIARASRDEVKQWTMGVLHELVHEAHTARDRRVVTSATSELSKLAGTYAPQRLDTNVQVSVLDSMNIHELQALLRVLDDPALLLQAQQPQMIEAEAEEIEEEQACDPLS